MTPKEFVKKYHPFALETERKTGIDARFTLAQAALETGWGKSAPGNMFFGVKAGPSVPYSRGAVPADRPLSGGALGTSVEFGPLRIYRKGLFSEVRDAGRVFYGSC